MEEEEINDDEDMMLEEEEEEEELSSPMHLPFLGLSPQSITNAALALAAKANSVAASVNNELDPEERKQRQQLLLGGGGGMT